MRENVKLLRRIKVICPVQSLTQKYFCFSETQITAIKVAICGGRTPPSMS